MADNNGYINVARNKIAIMIRQKDFGGIVSIDSESTRLCFTGGRACDADRFGKVTWDDEVKEDK